jgi:hypothetical protein
LLKESVFMCLPLLARGLGTGFTNSCNFTAGAGR